MKKKLGSGALTIASLIFVMNMSSNENISTNHSRNKVTDSIKIERKVAALEVKKEITKKVLENNPIHKKSGHDHKECNDQINSAVDQFMKGNQIDDWDERHTDEYAQIQEQALEEFETTITSIDAETVSKESYLADIDKAARNSEFVSEGEASIVKYDANEEDLITIQ